MLCAFFIGLKSFSLIGIKIDYVPNKRGYIKESTPKMIREDPIIKRGRRFKIRCKRFLLLAISIRCFGKKMYNTPINRHRPPAILVLIC